MRLATWNVNSLKARLPKVLHWMSDVQPDVLCMQETKLADGAFPAMAFGGLGYEVAYHGDGRWNGVAIASRVGLEGVVYGFSSPADPPHDETRLVTATCAGLKVSSIYVPNGRSLEDPQYAFKLAWLDHLKSELQARALPTEPTALCGDFNIAPEDRDVYDPAKFAGATHVSEAERSRLAELESLGLTDAFRLVYPDSGSLFSWWDYRAGDFHKHRGMRIDLVLVSDKVARRVRYALIDREARKGMNGPEPPSDHAPMFVDIDWPIGPASA